MVGSSSPARDKVRIRGLKFQASLQSAAPWPTSASSPDLKNAPPVSQPVHASVTLGLDVSSVASSDDLGQGSSVNYAALTDSILSSCSSGTRTFSSLEELANAIYETSRRQAPHILDASIVIDLPKALLNADSVSLEWRSDATPSNTASTPRTYRINYLHCYTLIGLNSCERDDRQLVGVSIDIHRHAEQPVFDYRSLSLHVQKFIEDATFKTLEAFASAVARITLFFLSEFDRSRSLSREGYLTPESTSVTVRAAKRSALIFADAAEVELTRTLDDFQDTHTSSGDLPSSSKPSATPFFRLLDTVAPEIYGRTGTGNPNNPNQHRVGIALGSNLGDRFANIERALRLLEAPEMLKDLEDGSEQVQPRVSVVDTSFMYETTPMYITDQPNFINCACMIQTNMEPLALLALCKKIEDAVGRVPSMRNGPRAVDLDILLYDDAVLDTRPDHERTNLDNLAGQLVIPHPRMGEREFVLRPLADMIPDCTHPRTNQTIRTMLDQVMASTPPETPTMYKVTPFPRYPAVSLRASSSVSEPSSVDTVLATVPSTATYWTFPLKASFDIAGPSTPISTKHKTYLMSTLNATPDSFSDGSDHNTAVSALGYARDSVIGGADIIDVGGYSTKPGAAYVSNEKEIGRVVPVIQAIRSAETQSADEPSVSTKDVLISVDTFRWDVAQAAVRAGANCINDVYAFTGPAWPLDEASAKHFVQMRKVSRDLAAPVILMHSRGDAGSNKDYSAYRGTPQVPPVMAGVRTELGERVEAAVKGRGGLRRWLVLVDPGIGFSKSVDDNLAVLRQASALTARVPGNPLAGYPQLIGTSRKSFLGAILAQPDAQSAYAGRQTAAKERGWATAAAVACAVQQGVAVVRVHDVLELGDVVRVSDALWR
ncbi:Dihydropteroate synthase [Punctularia strigosozonata HHB-11173 SS5]|uniref:Dihydropteroate synthase n=1 Tax=Punctularia strigosozonata (strain HHB-11173) TaxID=741275 RepID=UPI0004417298|nr:Dihydropteroate synthase [Punctularia strigosozonata HHB-11173 SS5]EIN14606.1 Dihydropteroate synthase [Punctularia strigosozonata HHB-11173 SS5]